MTTTPLEKPSQHFLFDAMHRAISNHFLYGSAGEAYLQGMAAHRFMDKALHGEKLYFDTETDEAGVKWLTDWKMRSLQEAINRVQPFRITSIITQLALE